MTREITPEPPPEHEEAIDAAFARLLADPADERSAWWREGVRAALEDDA